MCALGLVAGALAGTRSRTLGWTVLFATLFAGAVTASFMVGWAPVIAALVIRN